MFEITHSKPDRALPDVIPYEEPLEPVCLNQPLDIAGLTSTNRVFLAPMSGVTDLAFRKLAANLGAGLVFSEMVASEALVTGKTEMRLKSLGDGLGVHAVQIAGRQANWMALAATMAEDNGADLIDINMGCPSRRVTTGLSGSALMRDLDHALELIEAVVNAVEVPVTLKMRLGWDHLSINAPQLAARAQSAGIKMITVHARTRCQFYNGEADWSAVRAVRSQTNLPLIINGDIKDTRTAKRAVEQSHADGVMVGRACYGAPFLPAIIAQSNARESTGFAKPDIKELVLNHFDAVLSHAGKTMGIRQFRKHLGWYLDKNATTTLTASDRRELLTSNDPDYICTGIKKAFAHANPSLAA